MKEFGSSSSQYGLNHYPTLNLVMLSDALSTEPLAIETGKYESSERDLAQKLFEKISQNEIILLDRGLGGKNIYQALCTRKIFFINRVSTKGICLKEVTLFLKNKKESQLIELKINSNKYIKLRLVRGKDLKLGVPIVYATNLLDEKKYSSKEIHELYRSRWQIETNIGHLKNTLGLEKNKSKTKNSIFQDIYAHLIVQALAARIEMKVSKKIGIEGGKKSISIKYIVAMIADKAREFCRKGGAVRVWRIFCKSAEKILWTRQRFRKYPRYSMQPQNRWSQERSYLKKGLIEKNLR